MGSWDEAVTTAAAAAAAASLVSAVSRRAGDHTSVFGMHGLELFLSVVCSLVIALSVRLVNLLLGFGLVTFVAILNVSRMLS